MEKITYKEASMLLNKHYDTIKQAIERGSLTKYLTRNGRASLIKEQVMLFKEKTQISIRALNTQELEEWKKYDELAKSGIDIETADAKEALDELRSMTNGFRDVMGTLGQMLTGFGQKQYKHASASQEGL